MTSSRMCAAILCLVFFHSVYADFSVYTIDGQFDAVFPGNPQLTGEMGEGEQRHRSYNYVDESNVVVYTATYQVGQHIYPTQDIPAAVQSYVKGQALTINGTVESYVNKVINGNTSATFAIAFAFQGIPAEKHGVVSYKDGRLFQWAVQDFPARSKQSANTIFRQYLPYFLVK